MSSGINKIRIAVTAALFILFIFANLYTVRKMARYGMELYFYDKMNVAYQTGGMTGLRNELDRAIFKDNMPQEARIATGFKKDLNLIDDPGVYLSRVIQGKKQEVKEFRNLRNLAFVLIAVIFLLRLMLDLIFRRDRSPGCIDK